MLTREDVLAATRELCKRSFADFIRLAWPSIIPDNLQWNWHIDAVAEHLQAVSKGEINRLLINIPPGTSKSTITGVMYPAWLWGPGGQPHHRYIGAAHEQGLAIRDNRLMRELVLSEWYQELWPTTLKGDQNEKLYFENNSRGFRQACAVSSMTGRRGHCLIGSTLIQTTEGEKTIREIVNSSQSCDIISYDTNTGKLVQRPIQAVARGSSRYIYRVHFTSGRVVTCSQDHKFYTSRGYVEARLLSEGDSCVQLLPQEHGKNSGRGQEVSCKDGRPNVLRSVVFDQRDKLEERESWPVLHGMREEDKEKRREKLLRGMQAGGISPRWNKGESAKRDTKLRDMQIGNECPCEFYSEILQQNLCIHTSQDVYIRGEQPCLAGWRGQAAGKGGWFLTGMDKDTDENCGSRPWEVRRLRVRQAAACPSYRRESPKQSSFQSGDAVLEVPFQVAWSGAFEAVSDTVALVEELCGERVTYDLQVDGTNCFFANGILVHNSIVWDDPLSPAKANSPAHREEAIRILTETVPTRLNDPDKSAIIVVMQRLHEDDPSGYILSKQLGYEHLCIPMEFEPERRKTTSIGWTDPRTKDGELLDANRFPAHVVARDKVAMGSYAWAGQMQQRPSPRGGGLLKDEWWKYYDVLPPLKWRGIWADTAQKAKESSDYSVFQCWGETEDGRAVLVDQVRGKWEAPELLSQARAFWQKHKEDKSERIGYLRSFRVEDKVSGTGLIQTLSREGIPVQGIQRSVDKVTRVMDVAPSVEAGLVLLPRKAAFLSDFLSETAAFPNGKNDDQVDPLSDAVADIVLKHGESYSWDGF